MSVLVGISVADQILTALGLDLKEDIGGLIAQGLSQIGKGGDKRTRLLMIETEGMAAVRHAAMTLKAIEGSNDESAAKVREQLIAMLTATILQLVKTADLDGSSSQ